MNISLVRLLSTSAGVSLLCICRKAILGSCSTQMLNSQKSYQLFLIRSWTDEHSHLYLIGIPLIPGSCCLLFLVAQSFPTLLQPHGLYAARQASLPMRFSRQDYWSGLPCLPLGDIPDLGIEPWSPELSAGSLPTVWATRDAPKFLPTLHINNPWDFFVNGLRVKWYSLWL